MKKILLVSGDSFSDKNFQTFIHPELDTSWPKWPELLAKKLDMECVNIAASGAGNDYIYEALLFIIIHIKKTKLNYFSIEGASSNNVKLLSLFVSILIPLSSTICFISLKK